MIQRGGFTGRGLRYPIKAMTSEAYLTAQPKNKCPEEKKTKDYCAPKKGIDFVNGKNG